MRHLKVGQLLLFFFCEEKPDPSPVRSATHARTSPLIFRRLTVDGVMSSSAAGEEVNLAAIVNKIRLGY